ncbi:MAG: hypothetical protein FJW95_05710 [Actinobacteria bacterium]|nr:hypothetical protein [Actinomycetota bacterium]
MLAFLLKRPIRWILMAMAIPVTVWVADTVAEQIEARRGPSKLTSALRFPGRWRRRELTFAD